MNLKAENHYATLGLDRDCTLDDIRAAYRALAKMFHPDVNQTKTEAIARTQEINCAYTVLSNATRRRAYDEELEQTEKASLKKHTRPAAININQDIHVGIRDLIGGTTLTINVNDPARVSGAEAYDLEIPPETAPGARFRLKRIAPFSSGFIQVRVKVRPDARFKARGSDLRCDLKINTRRATTGGSEQLRSPTGGLIMVKIPPHVGRHEIIRVSGEGLPKPRGGRGDLLVRICYRPEVRITRGAPHKPAPPQRGRLKLGSG